MRQELKLLIGLEVAPDAERYLGLQRLIDTLTLGYSRELIKDFNPSAKFLTVKKNPPGTPEFDQEYPLFVRPVSCADSKYDAHDLAECFNEFQERRFGGVDSAMPYAQPVSYLGEQWLLVAKFRTIQSYATTDLKNLVKHPAKVLQLDAA